MNTSERTLYQIEQDVRMSARYHQLVERMFLVINDATVFLGLITGSAAVAALVREIAPVAAVIGAAGALLHAINLAMGSVRKATAARDQYRRYQELLVGIAAGKATIESADADYLRIERDDAPIIEALRKIAQVDNLRSRGHEEELKNPALALNLREKLLRGVL